MALQKQVISVPMGGGIDTKTAPVLVDNQKYQLLQNATFVKGAGGALHKRNGYSQLPAKDGNGNPLTNVGNLAVFDEELVVIANQSLYNLSAKYGWVQNGPFVPASVTEFTVARSSFSATNPDMIATGGVQVFAWEQNGLVFQQVMDISTRVLFTNQTNVPDFTGVHFGKPKQVLVGTTVYILCSDGFGGLWAGAAWSPSSFNVPTTLTQILGPGTLANNGTFDACYANGSLVAVASTAANVLTAWSFNVPALTLNSTQAVAAFLPTAFVPVTCCTDGTTVFVAGTHAAYNQIAYAFLSSPGLVIGMNGTITAVGAVARITSGVISNPFFNTVKLFVETSGNYNIPLPTADPLPTITSYALSFTTGFTSSSFFIVGASITSQPFVASGNVCIFATYSPTLPPNPTLGQLPSTQQTLFLLGEDDSVNGEGKDFAYVYGKFFTQTAGAAPTNQRFPMVQALPDGSIAFPGINETELETQAGRPIIVTGLTQVALQFTNAHGSAVQLGQNLHYASGMMLYDYDGTNIVEHGFNVFPETPVVSFLTSQIQVIVNSYNSLGTAGVADTIDIYIPDNPANPGGPIGGLITPGEYISVGSGQVRTAAGAAPTYGAYAFYFVVDGAGAAPTGVNFAGFIMTPINISSQHTATNVATILQKALNAVIGTPITGPGIAYTPTYTATPQVANAFTPQKVHLVAFNPLNELTAFVPPSMNRTFNVYQGFIGDPASTRTAAVFISCCPANLIQGGQYFQFQVYDKTAVTNTYGNAYVWFQVPGYTNGDPKPLGPAVGETSATSIQVTLLGSEDAGAVAVKVNAAIVAALPNGGAGTFGVFTVVTGSNIVVFTEHTNATYPNPQFDFFAVNPQTNTGTVNPDWVAGVAQNAVGANITGSSGVGIVQYEAIYEWQDANGQLHRSHPSPPATAYVPFYSTSGGVAVQPNAAVKLSIFPYTITAKRTGQWAPNENFPTNSEVDIAIYRTPTNVGSVAYRVTSPVNLLYNTPIFPQYINYSDNSSELGILSNEPIYTTSSLAYDTPPATGIVVAHGDRLWLSGLEDPNLLWYSMPWQGGLAVSFSNEQTIRINPSVGAIVGGPITQLSPMDGNLVVFEQSQIWAIGGAGPNALGLGTQFGDPQLISATVGCRDPGSVQLGPSGLYFKSLQGFYLLNRQTQIGYMGDEVEGYNADVVVSSQRATDSTQIRFLSQTGTTLLYDFYYDQWGPITDHQGTSDVLTSSGVYTYSDVNGRILQEAQGSTSDAGIGYPMLIQTAWIKFSGIQGFMRLWKMVLKGLFVGTQPLQIQIAYDYNPTAVDTFVYNQDPGTASVWGSDPIWGSSTPWGGVGAPAQPDVLQLRIFPSRQLCEAVQLTIQDLAPFPTAESWSLDAIDFEVGVRKGAFRNLGGVVSLP